MGTKKILMVTLEYYPIIWGGIATVVQLMINGFQMSGTQVILATIGDEKYSRVENGVFVIKIPRRRKSGESHPVYSTDRDDETLKKLGTDFYMELFDLLPEIDSIICHNEELFEFLRLVKENYAHKRLAYFCHGLQSKEHPNDVHLHNDQEIAIGLSDYVLTASQSMQNQLNRLYPGKMTNHIILPLSLIPEIGKGTALNNGDINPAFYMAAGRMVPQKGFDLLIEAYGQNINRFSETQLKIYAGHGNQDYSDYCFKLLTKYSLPKTTICEWLPYSLLLEQLSKALFLIVPSRFEPLGLIAAEALALGVPVIASQVDGLCELLDYGNAGVLVECAEGPSIKQLGDAMSLLYSNENARRVLAVKGKQHLKTCYSLQRFIESVNSME